MSPTFEIACSACGGLRWPVLAAEPASYLCARCTAVPPKKREGRAQAARKRRERRKGPQQSPPSTQ